MDAKIGSALISAGGGLLGSIFGAIGQNSANKAMLKATRETNAQNYKIWQEQQNHNRELYGLQHHNNIELWNMQNEYNDPSNQMERLRNAGLNPYMAISGNNPTGVATNSPASATAQPAQAPTMQAPPPEAFQSPMLTGLNQGLSSLMSLADAINKSSSTYNLDSDTKKKQAELSKIVEDTRGTKLFNDVNEKYLDYRTKLQAYIDFFNYKRTEKAWENDVAMQDDIQLHMKAMRIGQQLSNEQQEILNVGLSAQRQADLALTIAQEAETLARTDLTRKQIEEAAARITKMYWDNQLSKAMIGYYGSMTSLNQQTYQFNEDTNDLRIEGMTLDNTGKSHDNISKSLENMFKKRVVEPMIENAISKFKLETLKNQNDYIIEGERHLRLNDPVLGPFFRNSLPSLKEFKESVPGIGTLLGF